MMSEPQHETRAVFLEALALNTPEERARHLDAACRDQPALRQRVEELLRAHDQAGGFLQQDLLAGEPGFLQSAITEAPGTIIGRCKLLEPIGEGGFGVVFMAEQIEPIRRRVAIKIVKPGMDTREVIARFEAERQALALMDHPNIAHVFDAGATDTGRPFFVMELVPGVPITHFCDANDLSPNERLSLFQTVCEAVQHAHQKGIIHRDLKPSNILVTLHDGKPVPKVIDFGTAKALQHPLTEKTLFTAFGRLIGTPQYMSPEQAELSGLDVDTRADIYSLGVLLYELLTGTTPFEADQLRSAAFGEMLRIIREEEPPKPSTRVSTLGERATAVAGHRKADPALLRRTLRGDLDWIVMKALEKDRTRRYDTASALVEDIQHHLDHEPVLASPPGRLYRTRKFIRRHRMGVALASSVTIALLAGLVVSLIGFAEAKREGARAEAEAATSEAVNRFLTEDLLGQASPEAQPDREVKLRTLVERAEQMAGARFNDRPLVELDIRLTLEKVHEALGQYGKARAQLERAKEICRELRLPGDDRKALEVRHAEGRLLIHEGNAAEACKLYEEILPLRRKVLGDEHPDTLATIHGLALVHSGQGHLDEARRLLEEILAVMSRTLGEEHPDTLKAIHNLANVHLGQGRPEEARRIYEEVLAVRRRTLGEEHPDTLRAIYCLAAVHFDQGRRDEARRLLEEILPVRRKVLGDEHPDTLGTIHTLASVHLGQGRLDEARRLLEEILAVMSRTLGEEHPDTLKAIHNLAAVHSDQGRPDEAQRLYEEVLAVKRRTLGDEHPATLATMHDLALVHRDQGRLDEARRLLEEVLAVKCRTLGEEHPETLTVIHSLAVVHRGQGHLDEARRMYEEVLAAKRRTLGDEHPATLGTIHNLALIHQKQGRLDEARRLLEEILPVQRKVLGGEHPDTLTAIHNLAAVHMDQGRPDEALRMYEEVLAVRRKVLGEGHPDTLATIHALALVHQDQGRPDEALRMYEEVLAVRRRTLGEQHPATLNAIHRLALAHLDQGRLDEARRLLEEILPVMRKVQGGEHPDTLNAINNLAVVHRDQGRPDEARRMYEEILAVRRRTLGEQHPDTLDAIHRLALAHLDQGRLDEARRLLEEILPVMRKVQGGEDPNTLATIHDLALVHRRQGRVDEARRMYEGVLAVKRRTLGDEHPDTLLTINNLADVHLRQGRLDEARRLYEEILPVQRKLLGMEHPDTVRAMRGLAAVYRKQPAAEEMASLYSQLLSLEHRLREQSKVKGIETTTTLAQLASSLGDWPRAAGYWRERIDLADDLFIAHRHAALAALMAGDSDGYAKECNAMLAWVARGAADGDGQVAAETSLAAPHPAIDLAACARLADEALQRKPSDNWTCLVKGMAEYRTGDVEGARIRFEALAGKQDANLALTARLFLAMCHHRLGNDEVAKKALAAADRSLESTLRRGSSLGGEPRWASTAAALAVRAEAEREIFGKEVSPTVDMASLAAARAKWRPVSDLLQAGKTAALAGEWDKASEAFVKALDEPGFEWALADAEVDDFMVWLGVASARGNDAAGHEALCRRLAARLDAGAGQAALARKVGTVCGLRPGTSPGLLALGRELLQRAGQDPDLPPYEQHWAAVSRGLLEYRSGNPAGVGDASAASWIPHCWGVGTLLEAMAARQLGREEDADRLMRRLLARLPELETNRAGKPANLLVFRLLFDEAKPLFEAAAPADGQAP